MVKAQVFGVDGKKMKMMDLPEQFSEEARPDLIRRAHLTLQSHMMHPQGAFLGAGKRQTSSLSRRRRDFKTSYGKGMARSPRKTIWRRGTQFGWVGAVAPNTPGGRRAHPPKAHKDIVQKLNVKERRKAIRSALALSIDAEKVKERGHFFTELPTIVESKIEELTKAKDVEHTMLALGLEKELERISVRKIRAGKGKMRGRKYRTKKGPLIVVAKACKLQQAGANLLGVDICVVSNLNVNLLAPGGVPGRLTLYSEKAIERLKNEGLFTNAYRAEKKQ